MTLILTIQNREALDADQVAELRLEGHGALIGRSPHADWYLPDPRHHISSRHCEISYRDDTYLLIDRSTNGTFVNDAAERLTAPHVLRNGDQIAIGPYRIAVRNLMAEAAGTLVAAPAPAAAAESAWSEWNAPDAPAAPSGWADAPIGPLADTDPGERWEAAPAATPQPEIGIWDLPEPQRSPSDWASAPRGAAPPSATDLWGQLAAESEIDWSRGDFGPVRSWSAEHQPAPLALPMQPVSAEAAAEADPAPVQAPPAIGDDGWAAFLKAAGLPADRLRSRPAEALASAGAMLRQMVSGLILMVDARARAKAQLGVQATSLELDGNNPFKFLRSPDRALLQLLEPPERGFMAAARAVEDAYEDLQAHQMATLSAMRGALAQTLEHFAPDAIRDRQHEPMGLARWFRQAREAALWRAYVRDFEGVVRGADEAFMDLFAKEFRTAYEQQIAEMRERKAPDGR